MLSVAEALAAVLAHARPLPPRAGPVSLGLGQVLAEDVVADIDSPPFDKAIVDGFAVRSDDLGGPGTARLQVVGRVFAGEVPDRPVGPGEAIEIMTGAPLPPGADAVVMIEKVARPEGDPGGVFVTGMIRAGQNRLVRGREFRAGEVVVPRGTIIDAAILGLLASVGAVEGRIRPAPSVVVFATGDELVVPRERPGPGQIRNSNGVMLSALSRSEGAEVRGGTILPDRADLMREAFAGAIAGFDVILISGGVSAGKKDLVPDALTAVGVAGVFHKVRVKPGKPSWFGVGPAREGRPPALVFGLPGNPVSGLVGFLLFVRPALAALSSIDVGSALTSHGLAGPFRQSDERETYRPARVVGGLLELLDSAGSADLRSVAFADGFAIFPSGERTYQRGESVDFLPIHPPRRSRAASSPG